MSDVIDAYNSIKEDGGKVTIIYEPLEIIDPVEESDKEYDPVEEETPPSGGSGSGPEGPGEPEEPSEEETEDPNTYTTYGVQLSFTDDLIDGSLIKYSDCKIIVPALGIEDLNIKKNFQSCKIIFGEETWKILNVKSISPYGTDIIYYLHSRK